MMNPFHTPRNRLGGDPGRSEVRLVLQVSAVLAVLWLTLVWIPNRASDNFEVWRTAQIQAGAPVDRVPADIHAEWVRMGLWTLLSLSFIAVFLMQARAKERQLTRETHLPAPDPALPAIDALRVTLDAVGEQVASINIQHSKDGEPASPVSDSIPHIAADLANEQLVVRIGALHSLDRLARWDPEWKPAILEIFAAFLRDKLSAPETPIESARMHLLGGGRMQHNQEVRYSPTDPAAKTALMLFLAIPKSSTDKRLHLGNLDLRKHDLTGAHLEGINLAGSLLGGACIEGTHFEGADLSNVIGLSQASLGQAHVDARTLTPDQSRQTRA